MRQLKINETRTEVIFVDTGAFLAKAWKGTVRLNHNKGYIDILDEKGLEIATFFYRGLMTVTKEA